MKKILLTSLLLLMLFISCSVSANTSLWGPTGLITIPTADILGHNALGLAYYFKGGAEPLGKINRNAILLNYGYNHKIEGGLTYLPPADFSELIAHLKVRIIEEIADDYLPSLAVGIIGKSPYFVASKSVGSQFSGFRLHLGYGLSDLGGIFIGAEKVLNAFSITDRDFHLPLTTLMAEYSDKKFNLGLSFEITPTIRAKTHLAHFKNLVIGAEMVHSF